MGTDREVLTGPAETSPAEAGAPDAPRSRGRLASFVTSDHRYVFLGTSVLALAGIWLSMQPSSPWSFLRGAYAVEVVLYYVLVAWVALSLVALANKLVRWHDYMRDRKSVV